MEVDTVFFLWSMFPAAFFPENMDWAISNANTLSSFLSFTSFLLLAFKHSPNVCFKLLILLHLKYLIFLKKMDRVAWEKSSSLEIDTGLAEE